MKPFLLFLASRQVIQKCFALLLWSLWASLSSQGQSNQSGTLPAPLPILAGITSQQHQVNTGSARALAPTIRYVKAGASGDGSSWNQASGNLQAMINASASGDQVWIAGGTYKPGTTRSSSFSLKNGVSVLGGFTGVSGTEGNANARTAMPSSTTLSGDIGTPNDRSDNCYHVFFNQNNGLNNTAILDGVVIMGGNSNGTFYDGRGGGVSNHNVSPSLSNCVFSQNSANDAGGAIYDQVHTQPTKLTNCYFMDNASAIGKDIFATGSNINLVNCFFTGGQGIAFMLYNGAANLTNCTFRGNGNGATYSENSTLAFVNCLLWNNARGVTTGTSTSLITVRYSVLQAGVGNYTDGGNNQFISRTPFINARGPQLLPCAPAIDAGDNAANSTATDVLDNTRKIRTIDIGAAEFDGTPYTVAVSALATPNPVCASSPTRLQATASNSLNTPYSYTWTAPAGASLSNANLNPTTATATTAGVASFSVLVSDAVGCLATNSVNVTVNALPTANILTPSSTTLTCSTPSISLTATGGGTYRWNNNSTNAVRTVTTSGTYSVTVTNANGCTATDSQVINSNTTPPTANILTPASTTLTCSTPSLSLTATGGGTYRWNNNTTAAVRTITAGGTYSVTVTAPNGCTAVDTQVINTNTSPPTANILTPASTTLTCSTPSLSLTATGGGTYRWNNNSTNAIRTVTSSGTYSVTVTSPNGCTATDSQVINSNTTPPTANILTPASATLTCTTTALNLTATGGGTYRWNNNTTAAVRSVNASGTYSVTVTAPNGCTATDSQVINSNTTAPTANILVPASTTLTCTTTALNLTATGGGTYRWNNNSTNAIRSVTTGGTYSVTVTAPNGCTATDSQVINSNTTPPTANILTPASATLTCTATALSLTATGGGTYRWDNNSTNSVRSVTTAATYSVTVTAPNGCTAVDTQVINTNTNPPTANILTPASTTLTCSTPSLSLTATGGGTYRWNDNSTNAIRTVTSSGTYSVTVTSPNGCTATDSQVIAGSTTPPSATIAYAGSPFSTTAAPINLTRTGTVGGTYTASPSGLSLNASTGQITPASSTPGNYTVTYTVAASGACSQFTTTTTLAIQAPPTADLQITLFSPFPTTVPGNVYAFRYDIINNGPLDATNVVVTSVLPASVTAIDGLRLSSPPDISLASFPAVGNTIQIPIPLIQAGQVSQGRFLMIVYPATTGILTVTASVSASTADADLSNNTASASVTLTPQADLSLTLSNNQTAVQAGSPTTYTLVAANSGPSDAPNVTVTDILPASLTGVSWTASGAGGGTIPVGSGTGNLNQAVNLPVGGSVRFVITGTLSASATGSLTHTASVTSAAGVTDLDPANNSTTDTDNIIPLAVPSITGFAAVSNSVCAGSPVTFTATVSNVTGSYSYTLSNGTSTTTATTSNTSFSQLLVPTGSGLQSFTLTLTNNGQRASATTNVTLTTPASATIAYAGSPFSTTVVPVNVTRTGTAGGTYTASPSGLSINASTGQITPANSALGSYTVTYTIAANGACPQFTATTTLAIQASLPPSLTAVPSSCLGSPVHFTFSATDPDFGNNTLVNYQLTNGTDVLTGEVPASTGSVTIEVDFTPTVLGPQTFTMTTVALGVPYYSASTSLTVSEPASATIAYSGSPFSTTAAPINVVRTGTAGGTYTASPSGLSINASTGQITPANSAPGNYTVTYAVAATGGCPAFTTTTVLQIQAAPINRKPVAVNDTVSTLVNTYITGNVLTNDSDPDGHPLTASLIMAPVQGTIVLNANGSFTYTPNTNFTGLDSLRYQMCDSPGSPMPSLCDSATVYVNVRSNTPTVTGLLAAASSVCAGSPVTFTATVGNVTGVYTFTLTNGSSTTTGNSSATSFSQPMLASGSGLQTFTLTVSHNGQLAYATTTVTIHALPIATLQSSGTITCGTAVTLTAGGGASYVFAGPSIVSQHPVSGTAVVNGAGLYSVTVTTGSGCSSSTSLLVEAEQTIPIVTVTPSSATLTCSNPSATLTANGTGDYLWSTGATSQTINATSAGTYSVTLTAGNGCSASASALVEQGADQTIGFSQQPASASSVTVGSSVATQVVITGPASAFQWYKENLSQPLASQTTAQLTLTNVQLLDAGNYFVVVSGSCNSLTSAAFSLSVTSPVTSLSLTASVSPNPIQTGQSATLNALASGGTSPYSYSFAGPGSINPMGNTATVSGLAAGVYSFTVKVSDATQPTAQQATSVVSLTVNALETAPFAITGVTTLSCSPITPNRFSVSFDPRYSGLTGQPISFSVANEMHPTSQPGPYTIQLYTDNSTITLQASQQGTPTPASFSYNWLEACRTSESPNTPPRLVTGLPNQTAKVGDYFTYVIPEGTFTDSETPLSLRLSAKGLPAGLSFSGATLSGIPSTTMGSPFTVSITATDPGGLSVTTPLILTILPATTPLDPTAPFAITGVTTISCTPIADRININFVPQYAGLNGNAIAFEVINETAPTTDPAPYSLTLYRDNPIITLRARQTGSVEVASFPYNWLAACSTVGQDNTPPRVNSPVGSQTAAVGKAFNLNLANTFADQETPNQLTLVASGLPAGLVLVGTAISGAPSVSGVSTVILTATDGGGLSTQTSFELTVSPASSTTVTQPTGFAITGVQTLSCATVSAGLRSVTFHPQYAGVTGAPISFRVENEMAVTTASGPYTLNLYTDNPTISLKASQSGSAGEASYSYNWLAACTAPARLGVGEAETRLEVVVLGNPVEGDRVEFEIRGAGNQWLSVELVDQQGKSVSRQHLDKASSVERLSLPVNSSRGLLLLSVQTINQQQQLKVVVK